MADASTAGSDARFNSPAGITTDGTSLYVTDTANNSIRKIVISASGVSVTTPVGASPGFVPVGIVSSAPYLYVTDTYSHTIRRVHITSNGIVAITTIAGAGIAGADNGTGTAAKFSFPHGIVWNATKFNFYVTDQGNHTIRQITTSANVTTLAGNADSAVGDADGSGADARFNSPSGISTDGFSLYVTDSAYHVIRKIDISGASAVVVTTLAGKSGIAGSADGIGINATFNSPMGIVSDGTNLYVADSGNNTIRKIEIVTHNVTTLAGAANSPFPPPPSTGDGTGAAARFNSPRGITTDGVSLYVTDTGNHTIRKIQ